MAGSPGRRGSAFLVWGGDVTASESNPNQPTTTDAGPEAAYFLTLERGAFLIQKCGECDRSVFYPRTHCPSCGADRLRWIAPKGSGTVYSTTIVRRKPEHGGDYGISIIELDEGVRLMSRVEGVAPGDVTIGLRVRAKITSEHQRALVVFYPDHEASSK